MTGIYKFTNILTNEAYIGQSVNIENICEYKTYKKIKIMQLFLDLYGIMYKGDINGIYKQRRIFKKYINL